MCKKNNDCTKYPCNNYFYDLQKNFPFSANGNGTFWVDYKLNGKTWEWKDGDSSVDRELLDMNEFDSQDDSVGECSYVKVEGTNHVLVKANCTEEHLTLCVGPDPAIKK